MTIEKILDGLSIDAIPLGKAIEEMQTTDKKKMINYYLNRDKIKTDPMSDSELSQLLALVGVLQIVYNSGKPSLVSDDNYDTLQEMLVDMGIPRLTGDIEINAASKVSHQFTAMRGTLDKVYYLRTTDVRTNKSRKYLDEWIRSVESLYEKSTGERISLNDCKVMIQPKFDGASCVLETKTMQWLTRGDTGTNQASSISHIMNVFNDLYAHEQNSGIKFEIMMSEENKDKINDLLRTVNYKNSRQIVTATINSKTPDFKVDFLEPIPLRIIREGETVEQIHPDLISKFPTTICQLSDRDAIEAYAQANKWVMYKNSRFRTDGCVITIIDPKVQKALGRDNNINNFEVAYKFTEEVAYSKVKDVEFYVSDFGFITPVLVVNDVILKGNTINRISLSNKERFDELKLCYGDEVKVLYDIIPYATLDEKCFRFKNGRQIKFTDKCPKCGAPLNLDVVQVQCKNEECPSIVIGRILNYCRTLRIQNIAYSTLSALHDAGLLKHGIRSLYKLKKKTHEMEDLDGFGKLKINKIISEINAKYRLNDYDFMGAIGIESLSTKTFGLILNKIRFTTLIEMLNDPKRHPELMSQLTVINGIGEKKAQVLIDAFSNKADRKGFNKLLDCVSIKETYTMQAKEYKGILVFTGVRPTDAMAILIEDCGYALSSSWTNKATHLVVRSENFTSSKVDKARKLNIPVITIDDVTDIVTGRRKV